MNFQHVTSAQVEAWQKAQGAKMANMWNQVWEVEPMAIIEIVMLKSAVMMLEVMGDGVPKEWGEPTVKTKHLYYWKEVHCKQLSHIALSNPIFDLMPDGSYFMSWTNTIGSERHHIGDAKKFGMVTGAPNFQANFQQPFFNPPEDHEDNEWLGSWAHNREDNSE